MWRSSQGKVSSPPNGTTGSFSMKSLICRSNPHHNGHEVRWKGEKGATGAALKVEHVGTAGGVKEMIERGNRDERAPLDLAVANQNRERERET